MATHTDVNNAFFGCSPARVKSSGDYYASGGMLYSHNNLIAYRFGSSKIALYKTTEDSKRRIQRLLKEADKATTLLEIPAQYGITPHNFRTAVLSNLHMIRDPAKALRFLANFCTIHQLPPPPKLMADI